jgi:hypothetical protein
VLSKNSEQILYEEGYVRTGIYLPDVLINRMRNQFNGIPAFLTNWGYFQASCLSNYNDIKNWNDLKTRLAWKFM